MSQLPDWEDDVGMAAWLDSKLNDLLMNRINETNKRAAADPDPFREWLASDGPAIRAAELDDEVTLLRKRYPHIARFIH
ncbi:MAG: hypothetical protein GY725_10575, partial [bacterium]|nr:hypothetical protein [bacterium]